MNPHPHSFPWHGDLGNGTYQNPILHCDFADPDVIRVGKDYWMTASSFNVCPGLPILHSNDMVNWRVVNYALSSIPNERFSKVQAGSGVWAPSLRYHAGLYWIFFPMPDDGVYVTTSLYPANRWSDPWLLQEAKGWIDPCPFWDDDGTAWLFHAYAFSRSGKRDRIHVRPMSPDGRTLTGEAIEVLHCPHHPYLEGPKVHKRDGWYYIMAPGGGVTHGWQVAFRSRSITGPYEEKVVLERGSTAVNGPHQGAFVDTPGGDWWFYHFQDIGCYGRVTHLQPVFWPSGNEWPVVGQDYDANGVGEPVSVHLKPRNHPVQMPTPLATDDEFDLHQLGLQWQWMANPAADSWSLSERPGWMRIRARRGDRFEEVPSILSQKFTAPSFAAETEIDLRDSFEGTEAGLTVIGGGSSARLGVVVIHQQRHLRFTVDGVVLLESPLVNGRIYLAAHVEKGGVCHFSYAGNARLFARLIHSCVCKAGGWMGTRIGLYCCGSQGYADFDYLRFSPVPAL